MKEIKLKGEKKYYLQNFFFIEHYILHTNRLIFSSKEFYYYESTATFSDQINFIKSNSTCGVDFACDGCSQYEYSYKSSYQCQNN